MSPIENTYLAKDIASAFVRRGIEEGKPLTQMKLQKVLYFAQGIHLSLKQNPLLKEEFQAWKFGPVIPVIYDIYKLYGSEPINNFNRLLTSNSSEIITLNNSAIEVINKTWELLKDMDAIKLSNWTHKEGSPWAKYYKEGSREIIIPNTEIRTYFEQFEI